MRKTYPNRMKLTVLFDSELDCRELKEAIIQTAAIQEKGVGRRR